MLVWIDTGVPSARGMLEGVRQFAEARHDWHVSIPESRGDLPADYIDRWRPDGVLGLLGGATIDRLKARGTPVVVASSQGKLPESRKVYSDPEAAAAIESTVTTMLRQSSLEAVGRPLPLVMAGGAMTISRALFARREGLQLAATPSRVRVALLSNLLDELAPLSVEERLARTGIPANRADILPAALIVILTLARLGSQEMILHTLRNLRFGLAAEVLEQA